jgi:hypothetical protein
VLFFIKAALVVGFLLMRRGWSPRFSATAAASS